MHWKIFQNVEVLHALLTVLAASGFFVFWARTRFWLPKYVHLLALIGLAVGLWCAANVPRDAPISRHGPIAKLLLVLALPSLVYIFFVLHGGQRAAFRRRDRISVPCPHCNRPVAAFRDESGVPEKVFSAARRCPHCGQGLE